MRPRWLLWIAFVSGSFISVAARDDISFNNSKDNAVNIVNNIGEALVGDLSSGTVVSVDPQMGRFTFVVKDDDDSEDTTEKKGIIKIGDDFMLKRSNSTIHLVKYDSKDYTPYTLIPGDTKGTFRLQNGDECIISRRKWKNRLSMGSCRLSSSVFRIAKSSANNQRIKENDIERIEDDVIERLNGKITQQIREKLAEGIDDNEVVERTVKSIEDVIIPKINKKMRNMDLDKPQNDKYVYLDKKEAEVLLDFVRDVIQNNTNAPLSALEKSIGQDGKQLPTTNPGMTNMQPNQSHSTNSTRDRIENSPEQSDSKNENINTISSNPPIPPFGAPSSVITNPIFISPDGQIHQIPPHPLTNSLLQTPNQALESLKSILENSPQLVSALISNNNQGALINPLAQPVINYQKLMEYETKHNLDIIKDYVLNKMDIKLLQEAVGDLKIKSEASKKGSKKKKKGGNPFGSLMKLTPHGQALSAATKLLG